MCLYQPWGIRTVHWSDYPTGAAYQAFIIVDSLNLAGAMACVACDLDFDRVHKLWLLTSRRRASQIPCRSLSPNNNGDPIV